MTTEVAAGAKYIITHPIGEVKMIPVEQIRPYEKNPRKIPDKAIEQVAKSITEFGWQQCLVVDGEGVIIIGHVRHQAALKLGLTEVPALTETRLTKDQTRALRIADNRTNAYSQWDLPLLLTELEGLDEDFSGVLDLADWREIIDGFEDAQDEALLDLDEDAEAIISDTYKLVCTFDTRENAEIAAEQILRLEGAVNVRYSGA
jgi:ParB-like nuclease domain